MLVFRPQFALDARSVTARPADEWIRQPVDLAPALEPVDFGPSEVQFTKVSVRHSKKRSHRLNASARFARPYLQPSGTCDHLRAR